MKWYSLKKYMPPNDSPLIGINDNGVIWTGIFTNDYEHENNGIGFVPMRFICDVTFDVVQEITHFCIPDPVEIDEK